MSRNLDNFFSALLTKPVATTGAEDIYLDTLPTDSTGWLVISPSSTNKREIIYYTAKGATYVTVAAAGRGIGGTTAQIHAQGAEVRMNVTAELLEEPNIDAAMIAQGRVSDAGGLLIAVNSWTGYIGGTLTTYAGSAGFTLVDNATNYVEISSAGAMVQNTSGYSADKKRLATVVTAAGDIVSITDTRQFGNIPGTSFMTAVSVATANGISGTSSGGQTPALTLALGAITPTSVAATGTVTGSNLTGTNTGDQDLSGKANVNQTMYIGTTAAAINRGSGAQSLTGVNIDGSSGSCTGNAATSTVSASCSGNAATSSACTGNSATSSSCTGNSATATKLQTARSIYGNNFDGSADLNQVIGSSFGGTGNGYTKFSGATTAEKTYTLPDASCNILTANGIAKGGIITGTGAGTVGITTVGTDGKALVADSSSPGGVMWTAIGGGTASAVTVANEASDTSCYPLFATAASGDLGPKTNLGLTFNASTGVLGGTFSGNVTGNVSGSSGSCTGNSATASKSTNLVGGNATTLLGSIPYQSNTDVTTQLVPNTAASQKFLAMTGDGTNGAVPSWEALPSVVTLPPILSYPRLIANYNPELLTGVYTDNINYLLGRHNSTATQFYVVDMTSGGDCETRNLTSDDATATATMGMAKIGAYVYVCSKNATSDPYLKIWRFASNDLAAGGTQMTISGTDIGGDNGASAVAVMISDGTNLYIGNTGGDTATTLHIFRKYTISGTTLTYVADITCGATSANFANSGLDSAGNFYGIDTSYIIRRHDSGGTLAATSTVGVGSTGAKFAVFQGVPYLLWDVTASNFATYIKAPLQP